MTDDHDLLYPQLNNTHQQAAYRAVKGAGNHAAGVFDHLHIAVADTQRRRKQLHQPGVHTGQDGDFLIRVLAGLKFFVSAAFHKFPVVFQQLFDHNKLLCTFFSSYRIFSAISTLPPQFDP